MTVILGRDGIEESKHHVRHFIWVGKHGISGVEEGRKDPESLDWLGGKVDRQHSTVQSSRIKHINDQEFEYTTGGRNRRSFVRWLVGWLD